MIEACKSDGAGVRCTTAGWRIDALGDVVPAGLPLGALTCLILPTEDGMRRGPSQARVEDLTVQTTEPEGISGFSVRH